MSQSAISGHEAPEFQQRPVPLQSLRTAPIGGAICRSGLTFPLTLLGRSDEVIE